MAPGAIAPQLQKSRFKHAEILRGAKIFRRRFLSNDSRAWKKSITRCLCARAKNFINVPSLAEFFDLAHENFYARDRWVEKSLRKQLGAMRSVSLLTSDNGISHIGRKAEEVDMCCADRAAIVRAN